MGAPPPSDAGEVQKAGWLLHRKASPNIAMAEIMAMTIIRMTIAHQP